MKVRNKSNNKKEQEIQEGNAEQQRDYREEEQENG